MNDDAWVVLVDAAVAQINKDLLRLNAHILKKGPGLLQLG